jgi:energy-coupling factor transporter ATP-binding protein EcfA2
VIKSKTAEQWIYMFSRECLQQPGQHIIVYGQTGAGKTTTMLWLLEGLMLKSPNETIVWFDLGKADESGTLLTFSDCRFIVPRGCKLDINKTEIKDGVRPDGTPYKVHDFEIVEIDDPSDPWMAVKRGVINVIVVYPFILLPGPYANVVSEMFTKLIFYAHRRQLIVPMTVFVDEFHMLAPASGHGVNNKHYLAAGVIQLNIDKLRATGVRLIGSSQGVTKLRKGVRTAFNWQIVKRGANFRQEEEPKLHRFNLKWQNLDNREMVLVYPTKKFSDIIQIDYYPRGTEIAQFYYTGEYDIAIPEKNNGKQLAEAACFD